MQGTKEEVRDQELHPRNSAVVRRLSAGDKVSAGVVLFGLAYFGAQAARVGMWIGVVIIAVTTVAIGAHLYVGHRSASYPRSRTECGR